MEDKIVEIARFYEPEEAQILESLRHLSLEKQIIALFILVAVFLALVSYFGSLVSSN